jgi:hypothetical protein
MPPRRHTRHLEGRLRDQAGRETCGIQRPQLQKKGPPSNGGRILVLKQIKYATTMIARRVIFQQHFRGNCCQGLHRAGSRTHGRYRPCLLHPAGRNAIRIIDDRAALDGEVRPNLAAFRPPAVSKRRPRPKRSALYKEFTLPTLNQKLPPQFTGYNFLNTREHGELLMRSPGIGPDDPSADSPFRCSAT